MAPMVDGRQLESKLLVTYQELLDSNLIAKVLRI